LYLPSFSGETSGKVRQFATRDRQQRACEGFVCTVWTMIGPSGKPLTCELWHVVTGLELRLLRNGELHRSHLARGPNATDELAGHADDWARVLRNAGFIEHDQ
jgi:hypothetical protein